MTGRRHGGCVAGVLLLGLAGCSIDSFTAQFQETGSAAAKPGTTASVDASAERVRATLNTLGVNAVLERDGANILLRCTSKSGKRFVLVFVEEVGPGGPQTR